MICDGLSVTFRKASALKGDEIKTCVQEEIDVSDCGDDIKKKLFMKVWLANGIVDALTQACKAGEYA